MALALMMDEAAPTPCSRTGFHMISISVWAATLVLLQLGSVRRWSQEVSHEHRRWRRRASRVDDDQVAGSSGVDRALDRLRGGDMSRGLAADGHRHGVDRLLAVTGGDDQLSALRGLKPPCTAPVAASRNWERRSALSR